MQPITCIPKTLIFHMLMWLSLTASATHNQPVISCGIAGSGDAIIVYDSLGGMTARTGTEPRLTVNADGKVILGNPYGLNQRIESQLDRAALQQLLDFIVETNGFFDIDVNAIQLRIREEQNSSGRLFAIADAGESIMRVCTGALLKETRFYALSHAAEQFPEITALQQLHAIEQELKRIVTWVRVGGDAGARAILASANEQLSSKHPDLEPLDMDNLKLAVTGSDGKLTVYFTRRGFEQQGEHMRDISVVVFYPFGQNTKPVITVNEE